MAPHIVWPLRFVLPHHEGLRPAWLLRLGLFLYDHLGGRKLPARHERRSTSHAIRRRAAEAGFHARASNIPTAGSTMRASSCSTPAMPPTRGAEIRPAHARRRRERAADGHWRHRPSEAAHGRRETVTARALVNAAGPWVGEVLPGVVRGEHAGRVRLVQGSHIVVRGCSSTTAATSSRTPTGASSSPSPTSDDFTLIGTTDLDYHGDPAAVAASEDEIAYLCAAASEYFRTADPTPSDVVWTYSGVRPLYDDGASKAQEATRDYVLSLDAPAGQAPLLSVFGGKITTYRRLAEAALEQARADLLPAAGRPTWTGGRSAARRRFPGRRLRGAGRRDPAARIPISRPPWRARLVRAYGTRARRSWHGAQGMDDLGRTFGAGLTRARSRLPDAQEWARGRTTCSGAAPSSACGSRPTEGRRSTNICGSRQRHRASAA